LKKKDVTFSWGIFGFLYDTYDGTSYEGLRMSVFEKRKEKELIEC
jgi:hypothetical protein